MATLQLVFDMILPLVASRGAAGRTRRRERAHATFMMARWATTTNMVAEATDDELVGRAGRGDKMAFGEIVARHQRRLMAVAIRSLGSRAAAEDVVQEVFTRAWVKAPSWQSRQEGGSASYGAWLARIAVNLCIDGARRRRSTTLDDAPDAPDPAANADEILLAQERATRVRVAIAALPPRQRQAISLSYDAELSNADGATAMETSVGAYELLLVRARRALRLSLAEGPEDP